MRSLLDFLAFASGALVGFKAASLGRKCQRTLAAEHPAKSAMCELVRGWRLRLRPCCALGTGWLIALALAVYSGPSAAQVPDATGVDHAALRPTIRRPEPIDVRVDYPPGASGSAKVTLEIVLDAEGHVVSTRALDGDEPFVGAALRSAEGFRFTPAERDGRPVGAKIRVEAVFEAPPEPEPEIQSAPRLAAPTPNSPTPPPAPPPSTSRRQKATLDSGIVEVRVLGERASPDSQSFTRAEARLIPGTFGDPLRAIESLPGTTSVVSGLPYLFVRGAPPGNVGTFVDGVRIPMLWHAFVGPSVLHPATIERVTLHRGGYPARYGRFAGAIVAVDTVPPRGPWRGESSVRVVDVGLMQSAPLSENGSSAALVSGRYSLVGPVVRAVSSETEIGYWDYQVLSQVDLGPHDRLGVLGFGAKDDLVTEDFRSSTLFHRVDPRYVHDFSDDAQLRLAVALGLDRTSSDKGSVRDDLVAPRLEYQVRFQEFLALRMGADAGLDSYHLDVDPTLRQRAATQLSSLMGPRRETTVGSYADVTWHPTSSVWFSPGVRADLFRAEGRSLLGFDPRLAARLEVSRRVAFEHTLGLAHQSASFVPGVPGAQVTNVRQGLQRTVQASSTVQWRLAERTQLSVTAFDAIYRNLADPLGTEHRISLDADQTGRRVRGSAYGLEFYLQRSFADGIGGYLSYTISRSERSYDSIDTLSSFDRTHVLSLALAMALGHGWLVGTRTTLQSGLPTRWATADGPVFRGDDRTEPFFRVDLRGEKAWVINDTASISLVMELLNASFSHETTERSCNEEQCTEAGVGPLVIPSVGVEARY